MKLNAIHYSDDARGTSYLVMVAHAGRNDRTGAKVHMATLTIWKESGRATLGACNCSNNGHLRGNLIPAVEGKGFERVSCKKCGASAEAAERRNAKATVIEILGGSF